MIRETQKSNTTFFNFSETENIYPPEAISYEPNRYEKKILLPHWGMSRQKSEFTQIPSKVSSRYNWYNSASSNVWMSKETSNLTRHYQQEFRKFVHYDRLIDFYQIRPVKIPFNDSQGIHYEYEPLILLTYSKNLSYVFMKPTLVDVRSDAEIRANWESMYLALRAANRYAKANGWRFCLIRDYFFNTPLFHNACFLQCFRNFSIKDPYFTQLTDEIRRLKKMKIIELVSKITQNPNEYNEILPQLWYLLACDFVGFDLTQPLTINSEIWFD